MRFKTEQEWMLALSSVGAVLETNVMVSRFQPQALFVCACRDNKHLRNLSVEMMNNYREHGATTL